jgi:hypothetical protein
MDTIRFSHVERKDPMKRQIVLALFAAMAFAGEVAAKEVFHSAPAGAVAVDGLNADWEGIPVHYLDKGPRVTAVANDERYLYVTFRFADLDMARTILSQGVVLWVNPGDESEASFGVRYRGTEAVREAVASENAPDASGGRPPDAPEGRPTGSRAPGARPGPPARAALGALEVMHFGAVDEVLGDGARDDGPAASAAVVDGAFSYEFRIPLAEVPALPESSAGETGCTLALGFQIGGLTKAEHDAIKDRASKDGGPGGGMGPGPGFGGGFGGAMGPGAGGGPRGGPPSGGRGARRSTAVGQIHWVGVILSGPGAGNPPPAGTP